MEITQRATWGAALPKSRSLIIMPSRELWLHHSADKNRGRAGVKRIQEIHQAPKSAGGRGWADIGYSFLIDPDSLEIFVGRGAGVLGAHTGGRNSISHGICVLGNYETETPSSALLTRIAALVRFGHEQGWWPNAFTGGHKDVTSNACPGDRLYARIPEINRLAGAAKPSKPVGGNEPNPYVTAMQKSILAIVPDALPEFGADGFAGAESANGAALTVDRYRQIEAELADARRAAQLQSDKIRRLETENSAYLKERAELVKQAEAGRLLGQAIEKLS